MTDFEEFGRPNDDKAGVEELIAAIIFRAYEDIVVSAYKLTYKKKLSLATQSTLIRNMSDAYWFFNGKWYSALCNIDKNFMLNHIRKEMYENGTERWWKFLEEQNY